MKAGWLRKRLSSCPFACPAVAVVAAIGWVDQPHWLWALLACVALVFSFWSRRWVWLLAVLLAVFAGGVHQARLKSQRAVTALHGDWWEGEMRLVSEEQEGRVELEFSEGEHQGQRVQAWLGKAEHQLEIGDRVFVEGRFLAPRQRLNPQVFEEQEWLARKGIQATFAVSFYEKRASGGLSVNGAAAKARSWVSARLSLGGDAQGDAAKVVRAMVLGERPEQGEELIEKFRQSGTVHVFAVSGLHVMMVGMLVAGLLRLLGCPRGAWIPLVIASMFFYALVTGLRPPALRAALMGAVLLCAWLVRRRIVLGNSVALCACVVLLWDGHLLFVAGFQLSFAVLVVIALLANSLARVFAWISYMDPFLPRSLYTRRAEVGLWGRRKLQGATVVGSCAWCGASPLTWWHFGLVSPLAVVVSLPMVLLLYLILLCSSVSLIGGAVWQPVGHLANHTSRFFAECAIGVASSGSKYHKTAAPWQEGERVVIYAMPEGESAVYLGIGGGTMLDVGSDRGFRYCVLPSLVRNGARVDSLVLSHMDTGHYGGATELDTKFSLKQVLLPVGLKNQLSLQAPAILPSTGERLALSDSAFLEVIDAAVEKVGVADDRCTVLCLHWRGKKLLFVQDAGFQFEQWVLRNQVDVSADVLVFGKHASDHSSSLDFIKQVGPSVVVAGSAAQRSTAWREKIAQLGVCLMLQDETGAVELRVENDALYLQEFESQNLVVVPRSRF